MRPKVITLEGFSAYRSRQTLRLGDVEFFSLSGPTGSGKSSLIDAMIFALYGRVPRLGARAVAPVITAGADRARVALEFEVDGEDYVVSRVAERTDSGASVREARLERAGGVSLASGAGEVTRAVEELLRLRFEDFTKTVVLPQGEFARFLNAGSKERRDLLRDLLGLEVYGRVRELANVRRSVAEERATSARSLLATLDLPEEPSVDRARERVETLERVLGALGEEMERLETAESELGAMVLRLERVEEARRRLEALEAPAHLEEMDGRLAAASEGEALAGEALEKERDHIAGLETKAGELPGAAAIAEARRTHKALEEISERLGSLDVEAASNAVAEAEREVEQAEAAHQIAGRAADEARITHAAHTVGATLAVGNPCPVCARDVESIPDRSPPEELTRVDQALEAATDGVRRARERARLTQVSLAETQTRHSELSTQRAALVEQAKSCLSLEEAERVEMQVAGLAEELRAATAQAATLEATLELARREHEEAAEAARSVGRAMMMARETIADLKPPHSASDDPMVQWKDLLAWRDQKVDDLIDELGSVAAEVETRRVGVAEMSAGLVETLTGAAVPAVKPYAVQVARAVEQARHEVSRLEDLLNRASTLSDQLETAQEDEGIAGSLAGHLKANAFERWLMAGAIAGLVSGANELLAQLSSGGYSLETDEDGTFRIIDHRSANEIRDVATLSGGETFLVSLALSLSLAESLSAAGGAGLDAIILDEGFGALDEESLDIVASVLEELAGRGLMVGIITHVKELAARAPMRYQVTRQPGGSEVGEIS